MIHISTGQNKGIMIHEESIILMRPYGLGTKIYYEDNALGIIDDELVEFCISPSKTEYIFRKIQNTAQFKTIGEDCYLNQRAFWYADKQIIYSKIGILLQEKPKGPIVRSLLPLAWNMDTD